MTSKCTTKESVLNVHYDAKNNDRAIMSGEGGGLRQGERERQGLFQY